MDVLPASLKSDRSCFCLSDPVRRSSLLLKFSLVALHLFFAGFLLLFDSKFLGKAEKNPWCMVSYCLLLSATLVQYFITSGSSPGYVVDAMRDTNAPLNSMTRQPASTQNDSLILTMDGALSASGGYFLRDAPTSWAKVVLDLYPPGIPLRYLTCSLCHVEQPPRTKHCNDCDRCVLQFDHHCFWIGTCIGQNNHCKFWWYVCGETALCIWTITMYIDYLDNNISEIWWRNGIIILLLAILTCLLVFVLLLLLFHSYLIMTNQTTYEFVRRRRIPYLKNLPGRVHPFSKGMCRNIYNVCCGNYNLELLALPTYET